MATSKSKPYDVRDQLYHRAGRHVSGEVRPYVRDLVWACVREEVEEQIRRQVSDQIQAELREQFPHLLSNIWGVGLGLHDAPWLASYDFFSRIGLDRLSLGAPLMELARAGAGWWWAFSKVAIVTSAPYRLNRDSENRLHCEHGPALAYPDGLFAMRSGNIKVLRPVKTQPREPFSRLVKDLNEFFEEETQHRKKKAFIWIVFCRRCRRLGLIGSKEEYICPGCGADLVMQ
jgi:hypothetical protein